MKIYQILLLFIYLFTLGCKSPVEKIGLNNLNEQRALQDSILGNVKTLDILKYKIDSLIEVYKNSKIKGKEGDANYYYYLGRIYSYIHNIPFKGNFFDTVNNKPVNINLLSSYRHLALENFEKSFEKDPNHFYSFYNILDIFFNDLQTREYTNNKNNLLMSNDEFSKIFNLTLNNATRVSLLDTTSNLRFKKEIPQISFLMLDLFYFKYGYEAINLTNTTTNDTLAVCKTMGDICDLLRSQNTFNVIKKTYFNEAYNSVKSLSLKAKNIIKRNEIIANTSFKHKYFYFDPETGYSSLIELYTDNDFTIVSTGGFNFHGTYSIYGDKIYFKYANKQIDLGDVYVDADESVAPSSIRFEITDTGTVNLISNSGNIYVQKDN
jgi:outer membrane lipoprotein-sorting protein